MGQRRRQDLIAQNVRADTGERDHEATEVVAVRNRIEQHELRGLDRHRAIPVQVHHTGVPAQLSDINGEIDLRQHTTVDRQRARASK